MPECIFCGSTHYKPSYLPSTWFNNKRFDVVECQNCHLHYLTPLPKAEDYQAMYPPSYQSGVEKTILQDFSQKIPGLRYTYQYKFDLIRKFANQQPSIKVLDYGCGNANFILNANHYGIRCDGTEFNPMHVEILRKEIRESQFFTVEDFLAGKTPKYDVIHLSNVLEHLDKPVTIIENIVSQLNPNGILLVEGPIEANFSPAQLTRHWYFSVRKFLQPTWLPTHAPTHIFFSNYQNQQDFFKKIPALTQLHYEAKDEPWPYPEFKEQAQGIGGNVKYLIGQVSKKLSVINPTWGNTFIYVGRKTN